MEIGEKGLENERFPIPTRKSILSNYNLMLSLSDALEFAKIHIFGIGINHTSVLGIWFAWTLSVLTLIFVIAMRGSVGPLLSITRRAHLDQLQLAPINVSK